MNSWVVNFFIKKILINYNFYLHIQNVGNRAINEYFNYKLILTTDKQNVT